MTDYPKEPKLQDFLKEMEHKAGNSRTGSLAGAIPIADKRTDEFLESMLDALLFDTGQQIERQLKNCLERTLIATGKKNSIKNVLYVTHVDQEEWCWKYVFGKTLLDVDIHVPTRDQIHEYYKWRVECLKAKVRIPLLPKETRDNVERMLLRQILAKVYAHADMLYAPMATWENVAEISDTRLRERVQEKVASRLAAARQENKFHFENGAPEFIKRLYTIEVETWKAIYREVRLPELPG